MDFQDSPDSKSPADAERLSIVEPVYVASYGKSTSPSTSPFYLIDQQQLLLSDALHQPDYRITHPASFNNSTSFTDQFGSFSIHQQNSSSHRPSASSSSLRLNSRSQENESLNAQFSRRQSEVKRRSFLQGLSDNLSQKIGKSFSSIKRSVYNARSRLSGLKQLNGREKLDDSTEWSAAGDKRSTLNRIASRLGKLVGLPKRRNAVEQATTGDADSNSKSNVNILRHSSNADTASDQPLGQPLGQPFGQLLEQLKASSSEEHTIHADAPTTKNVRDRPRRIKETHKALFQTKLNPLSRLGGVMSGIDRELNQIYSLAMFVERNLRIIGLEPIYQLLSFNATSATAFGEDENLKKLVKQIESKLVQNGEFNSLFSHLVPDSRTLKRFKTSDPSGNRKSSESIEELPNFGGGTTRRSSNEDDFNESDLLLELEQYVRSKRSTTSPKRKAARKTSKRNESVHDESISENSSKRNEGGNLDIRRTDNVAIEKADATIEKRVNLAGIKSRKSRKSRKRRSKKLRLKGKKNRKKSGRSQKGLKSKFKKASRKTSKKKKKNKDYIQSFPACDLSSESCKESEIHERYVPFVNAEEDDPQTSESYAGARQPTNEQEQNSDESGQYHEQSRESGNEYSRNEYAGNDYNHHQDDQQDNQQQSDRLYEPATNSYRQDDEFRPEAGRLKSSVKYEGQSDQANYQHDYQHDYQENNQANYGHKPTGGQSSYGELAEDAYKQQTNGNEDYEYGNPLKSAYSSYGSLNYPSSHPMFETDDGWSYTMASKPFRPYLAPDYLYESHASSWSSKPTAEPHDTKSLLKSLIDLKLNKKFSMPPPKRIPVYHHHHLDPHYSSEDENAHHYLEEHHHAEPPDAHHEKDELALVKELITNLLIENKPKILKVLKLGKLSHLLVGKQLLAATLKILFGKGLIAKKHLIIVAYKKCYIKIKTVDLLLIPGKFEIHLRNDHPKMIAKKIFRKSPKMITENYLISPICFNLIHSFFHSSWCWHPINTSVPTVSAARSDYIRNH